MVLAPLDQADRYESLHPAFAGAFAFLRAADLAGLAPGRHDIDGDRLYVSIDQVDGRGQAAARLEYHRAHIDIQVTIAGDERIGWRPLGSCRTPSAPFDPSRDIGFYADRPDTWRSVPPGMFVIFFPEDAHAPLAGRGPVQKAIVKIRTR